MRYGIVGGAGHLCGMAVGIKMVMCNFLESDVDVKLASSALGFGSIWRIGRRAVRFCVVARNARPCRMFFAENSVRKYRWRFRLPVSKTKTAMCLFI